MRPIVIALVFLSLTFSQDTQYDASCSRAKTSISSIGINRMSENQEDYDVTFYDINLKILIGSVPVEGFVGIVFMSKINGLSKIDVDLSTNMTVKDVITQDSSILSYTHINNVLSISLNKTLALGESGKVIINYSGSPEISGERPFPSFNIDSFAGSTMIWTQSMPFGARDWWPCKDTYLDKADSVNITITVKNPLVVASNGLLEKVVTGSSNQTRLDTYYWKERYPIPTGLVSFAIYPYTLYHDWYVNSNQDSMRLDFYVFPDHFQEVQTTYSMTKDMISAFAPLFGEYPFIDEKYGHAEYMRSGGMEHQTLSSLGGYGENLIAHELAHQWWGSMVTADWHHIWLNEGFARYSEALWLETKDGNKESMIKFMQDTQYFGGGTIYVSGLDLVSLYNVELGYNKAGWVLHMLRWVVGDINFFSGLKQYADRFRFSSVVTEDFRDVMEEVSGMDLDYFFTQWIYGSYYPSYNLYYEQNYNNIDVTIEQTALADNLFKMPIELGIVFADTTIFRTVEASQAVEVYTIELPSNNLVKRIDLDPNYWILSNKVSYTYDMVPGSIPSVVKLDNNYPNPFNPNTTIQYSIPNESTVTITVYDMLGKEINQLISQKRLAGNHSIQWNSTDHDGNIASVGIYFYQLIADDFVITKKMVLMK